MKLAGLCEELKQHAPVVAHAIGEQLPFASAWTQDDVHVVSLDVQGDDRVWVAWERPEEEPFSDIRSLTPEDRKLLTQLAHGSPAALANTTRAQLEQLAAMLLPVRVAGGASRQ